GAGGLADAQVHQETVPVLHQRVRRVGQLRRLAFGLLIESRLGIRGRDVRLVAALLAAEVDAGVRGAGRPLAAALSALRTPLVAFLPTLLGVRFRLEAVQGRPGFDQRAVYREVLAAHQARGPRLLDQPTEELPRNIMIHEALPVLREGA